MKKKDGKMKRKNDILLGPVERPTLQWLAKHMPNWVTSDTMTLTGIFASILVLFSFIMAGQGDELRHNPWLLVASFGLFLNWFGDSLDGTLARYRHMERPRYGYFVDHSVDGFSVAAIFLGYGFSGLARLDVAAIGAISYLLVMITVYLKTHVTGVFEMTTIKLGPTEIRIIGITYNLIVYFAGMGTVQLPGILGEQTIGTVAFAAIALILFSYYVVETIRVSLHLALSDGRRLDKRLEKEAKKAEKEAKRAEKEQRKLSKSKEMAGVKNSPTLI
ncbi:MAG: CDP-alcohol phosphatidyltransferase family protein [Anaerolineaceae bacterium]